MQSSSFSYFLILFPFRRILKKTFKLDLIFLVLPNCSDFHTLFVRDFFTFLLASIQLKFLIGSVKKTDSEKAISNLTDKQSKPSVGLRLLQTLIQYLTVDITPNYGIKNYPISLSSSICWGHNKSEQEIDIASRTRAEKLHNSERKKKFPAWFGFALVSYVKENECARASAKLAAGSQINCGRAFFVFLPTSADHSIGRGFGGSKLTVPLADFFRLWIGRAGGKYSPFLIIMRWRGGLGFEKS